MKTWHWFLSFRDDEEDVNLGGCMVITEDVDPPTVIKAAQRAYELECNPGGEVLGFTAEGSASDIWAAVSAMPEGVLMTREEVDEAWSRYGVSAKPTA